MNESLNPTEVTPNPEALDARWYRELKIINSQCEIVDSLTGDPDSRKAQKERFLSGESENPTLDTNIDLEVILKEEDELLSLKSRIIAKETNDVIKQAYRWRINEIIASLRMLKASASGDTRRFTRYSEFVYGKPDQEIFYQSIIRIRDRFGDLIDSEDQSIAQTARELFDQLPIPEEELKQVLPNQETIDIVKLLSKKELKELELEIQAGKKDFTAEEIAIFFKEALVAIGAEKWDAQVIETSSTGINTNQGSENIEIPSTRKMGSLMLKKLLLHEIRTHVERRVRGEASKLSLLGLGLDRYEGAEEGIATQKEQGLSKELSDFGGIEGHLAISLAKGVDGNPRNFKEVFEIMAKYFYLFHREKGKGHEEAMGLSREGSWKRCVRTFRGSDCTTKGSCLTKDMIYREGNIRIWDLVDKVHDAPLRFSIGKYDPSNERHIWILSQLGITDERLEELES